MNRDFYTGMFFGGIIALMIQMFLVMIDKELVGISPLIFVVFLDLIMGINLLIEKLESK